MVRVHGVARKVLRATRAIEAALAAFRMQVDLAGTRPLTHTSYKLYEIVRYNFVPSSWRKAVPDTMEISLQTRESIKDKRTKFVELAENRTKNAIKAIRVIAKLGNKNAYEFTDADVNKIAKALTREVELMKTRMSTKGGKEAVDFAL
jgi:reverse gyrase